MPENKDTDWDWKEFVERNNNSLVATWGNLANRVLSFAYKHWEGFVPAPGALAEADRAILETVEAGFASVGEHLEGVRLRAALFEALRLAGEVNKYLDTAAPWFTIKTDKAATATTIYTALRAIDSLKLLFAPFLPFSSERLHGYLGYSEPLFGEQYTEEESDSLGTHTVLRYRPGRASGKWEPSQLKPGRHLLPPAPLFKKLEEKIAEEERLRLGR
jgi:methionyl-tRNA synthetase